MTTTDAILVADGPPFALPDAKAALSARGYAVHTAQDAFQVLPLARRQMPAAVVLGPNLPGGGPLVVLRRLRSNLHTAATPLVVAGPAGANLAGVGADSVLELPVSQEALLQALEQVAAIERVVESAPPERLEDAARIAAVEDSVLSGDGPAPGLDRVTRVATELLGVHATSLSVLDAVKQVVKSRNEGGQQVAAPPGLYVSHTVCQWVVAGEEEVVVGDMATHPVLRHNRSVVEDGLRAYAGVPLQSVSGHTIGTLCASELRPRLWSDDDIAVLRDLADVTMAYAALGISSGDGARLLRSREAVGVVAKGILGANRVLRRVHRRRSAELEVLLLQITGQLGQGLIDAYASPG